MFRAGRFTAGAIMIAIGAGLLMNQLTGKDYITPIFQYWPLILIAVGVEFFIMSMINRNRETPVRFDFGSVIGAVVISLVVGIFIQGQFGLSIEGFNWLKGKRYEKEPIIYALDSDTENIKIENLLGDVTIIQDDVDQVEVKAIVYVRHMSSNEARKIADQATVNFTSGRTLFIQAEAERYRMFLFNNRPHMDLVITIPNEGTYDYEVRMKNGDFATSGVIAANEFHVYTTNGDIEVSEIQGDMRIETTNGEIFASYIDGSVYLKSTNGDIEVKEVAGDAELNTTNGEVTILDAGGRVISSTTNGDVLITGISKEVNASTTNGDVTINSSDIGGDWRIKTTNGKIELSLPPDGDYRVKGKTSNGRISSELGFNVSKRNIDGVIGSGTYLIDLSTNRHIEIKSSQ